ncbi:MAG: sigma-70 family RNA polymerase sigma factor [bacterium]|nr:sigma-70 family RNA polymerase sigma factor [bacterium]
MKRSKEQFLLFRIRAFGDEMAFGALLKKHGPGIQRTLHFKLPTQEDVEDAYTNVCVRFWQYATTTSVDHVPALMHTIARGVIADFYRSRKNAEDISLNDAVIASKERVVEQTDARLRLIDAIKQLDDDAREAITMRHIDGYSVKDIAKHFGKTENATSVLIHRAKKRLRTLLGEE